LATNFQVVYLGHIHIPGQGIPSSVSINSFAFGVWIVPGSMADVLTTQTCEIFDVELCPTGEGFWEMVAPSGAGPGLNEWAMLDCREPWTAAYVTTSGQAYKASLPTTGGGRLTLP